MIAQFGKRSVGRSKDGPSTSAQSIFQASEMKGGTQGGKVIETAGKFDYDNQKRETKELDVHLS